MLGICFLKMYFLNIYLIYLKDRVRQREGETKRRETQIFWFTFQLQLSGLGQAEASSLELHQGLPYSPKYLDYNPLPCHKY